LPPLYLAYQNPLVLYDSKGRTRVSYYIPIIVEIASVISKFPVVASINIAPTFTVVPGENAWK
jgi:hypothetical protein